MKCEVNCEVSNHGGFQNSEEYKEYVRHILASEATATLAGNLIIDHCINDERTFTTRFSSTVWVNTTQGELIEDALEVMSDETLIAELARRLEQTKRK